MSKLWCQEILEKEFKPEARLEPEEKVGKTDTELGTVPEWLRPLLWEMRLGLCELNQAKEATLKKDISGMTLPQFLAREAAATLVIIRQLELLHEVFWFEMRRAIPELLTEYDLVIRKGYVVVRSAPEEPEKGGEEERGLGLLIGLLRRLH